MKEHNVYTVLGLKALRRAAAKVAENAKKNNFKISERLVYYRY